MYGGPKLQPMINEDVMVLARSYMDTEAVPEGGIKIGDPDEDDEEGEEDEGLRKFIVADHEVEEEGSGSSVHDEDGPENKEPNVD